MKFSICTEKIFKNIVDKVKVVAANEKISGGTVVIDATRKNGVTFSIESFTEFYTTEIEGCNVFDDGKIAVDVDNLLKLCSVKGEIYFTDTDTKLYVKSDKKCSGVPLVTEWNGDTENRLDLATTELFTVSEAELLKMLDKIKKFKAKEEDRRPILTGYHFSIKDNGKSYIAACDRYKLVEGFLNIRKNGKTECEFTVYGECEKSLYKIGDKCGNGLIAVSSVVIDGAEWIVFDGTHDGGYKYRYGVKAFKGNFVDVDKLMNCSCKDYSFMFEVKPFLETMKEYGKLAKLKKEKSVLPAILQYQNGEMFSAMQTESYITADRIEGYTERIRPPKNFYSGFNPIYLTEAAELYTEDEINVYGAYKEGETEDGKPAGNMNGIYFDDGTIKAFILPMRLLFGDRKRFTELIERIY